ncbi:MAG: hypothetical protein ACYC96_14075 [Fimbriimonadaceae bacterium]
MPKNPKTPNYPPIRPVPPQDPRDANPGGGGGVDVTPHESLLLILSHVDAAVVKSLSIGEQVVLHIDSLPIVVSTVLGLPIGQVRLDGVDAVRGRRARRGSVAVAQLDPLSCAVEVR